MAGCILALTSWGGVIYAQQNALPNNGRVGIGTTTPTSRLDVRGSVNIDSALVVKDSVRINKTLRVDQNARFFGLTRLNETRVLMDFTAQGISRFNGELRANNDFISQGLAKFNGDVKMTNLEEISNLKNKYIVFTNENGKVQRQEVGDFRNFLIAEVYKDPTCDPSPVLTPNWSNGINKLFVRCPQIKVGIGTDVPIQSLDVRGNGYFSGNIGIGRDAESFAKLSIECASGYTAALKLESTNQSPFTKLLYMEYSEPSTEVLKVVNTTTNNVPYLFQANGRMSVHNGTTEIFKLYENGLLRVREVIIDNQNPWPDYVFEPTYSLKSLSELRTYIIANKHLPNVPSAKEVAENGVNIGEMNRILLEKVEELTIYLLQQQEEIDALKSTVNSLK